MPFADVHFTSGRLGDGTFVVSMAGPLGGDSGKPLTDELAAVLEAGATRVVIDLPGGSVLDRPALAVVEGLREDAGELVLVSQDPRIPGVITGHGLADMVRVVPALVEALA
jgi:hypothetical protein